MRWAFFVDGMPFQGDTLKSGKSLGGSETAGLSVAAAMARRGHDVHMFSRCDQEGVYDKVKYHHVDRFQEWAMNVDHDVTVVQRVPQALAMTFRSPLHLFWMHDLALGRYVGVVRGTLWNVDKVLVLSQFMKQQYMDVYGIPEETLFVTRNGIDLDLIESTPNAGSRDMKALVYTARPERGMDILLEETYPRLLQRDPELRLYLAGYDNYSEQLKYLYDKCEHLARSFAGRARHLGPLSKQKLYQLYKTCALYIYPSDFEEISCITAMETMACGLPMIGSKNAALPETLHPDAGILIDFDETKRGARNEEYQTAFCDAVMSLLTNESKYRASQEAGKKAAKSLHWDGVAAQWEQLAEELLECSPK